MVWHVYANGFKKYIEAYLRKLPTITSAVGSLSELVLFIHWLCTGTQTCRTEACDLVLFGSRIAMVWHVYANGFKNIQKLICVNCQPLAYFSGWQFKWVGFVYTLIMHWHLNVPNHGLWATSFCHTSAMVWHVYANGLKKYTEAYLRKLPTICLLQWLAV